MSFLIFLLVFFYFKNIFCSEVNNFGGFSRHILSIGDQNENDSLLSNNAKIFDKNKIGKDYLQNKIIFIDNKINSPIYNAFKESGEIIVKKIGDDFESLQDFKILQINPLKFENNKTEKFNIKIIKLEKNFYNEEIDFGRKIKNAKSILGINTFSEKVNNFFRDNKILIGLAGALGITYLYKKFIG